MIEFFSQKSRRAALSHLSRRIFAALRGQERDTHEVFVPFQISFALFCHVCLCLKASHSLKEAA